MLSFNQQILTSIRAKNLFGCTFLSAEADPLHRANPKS
ncbi:MAG: hypothetical protein OFPI_03780 [Osedax symbiont Rs2]|nr:MAG: hypothetical protein OFPI_03780 [Osedax symbiont Rs2]